MKNTPSTVNLTHKAEENFTVIKKSIKGIHEVLKLVLNENHFFYKIAMDNLLGLYDNFLQLMMNEYGANHFIRELRNSKIDIDISLDEFPLDKKSS